jgi:arylsulfatase A-like enzyme
MVRPRGLWFAAIGVLVSGAALAPFASGTATPATPVPRVAERPNVVLIVVDDARLDDMHAMPRTRRLLGDQGVVFENSFSPYPLCCPARASYLTGQYTHNHRVFSVSKPYAFPALDDSSTLATWLQSEGYATVLLGKYMNGYGRMPAPGQTTGRSIHYVPPGWSTWRASLEGGLGKKHPQAGTTYKYYDTTLSRNGTGFSNYEGQYQSEVYGRLAVRILERRARADRPFFLYLSFTAPHGGGPAEPDDTKYVTDDAGNVEKIPTPARPEEVKGMFDDVISDAPGAFWRDPDRSDQSAYLRSRVPLNDAERAALRNAARQRAESLHVVDVQVKQVVRTLRRSGELDNTLLIFTSDNGFFLGEQLIRAGKILPYEPSLRTPLLMRGPGIPAGGTRYDPIMSIDLAPTIAAAAGTVPRHEVDGWSMLEVARRGDRGWTRAVLTETGSRDVIRDTDEAGVPLDPRDPGEADMRWALGIRTPRFLYVDLATGEEELYDLQSDPAQYHNVVTDPSHAEDLRLLREELRRMRSCDAAACSQPMPERLTRGPATVPLFSAAPAG